MENVKNKPKILQQKLKEVHTTPWIFYKDIVILYLELIMGIVLLCPYQAKY